MGKYHVQVCTNISCLLVGGEELWKQACQKLGIGHKEVTADGRISLEEVECMGACSWAPAIQVNYDFYHDVTLEQLEKLIDGLAAGKTPGRDRGSGEGESLMLYNQPNPLEVRILTRRFGLPNSHIDRDLSRDRRLQGARKSAGHDAGRDHQRSESVRSARPRRRGLSHRHEVGFRPAQSPKPKYIMVNADETEPGTCKDRLLIEYDPHQLIEGVLIAGLAVGAQQGYIYIRGEYRYLIEIMDRAIDEAYARGYLGDNVMGRGFKFHLATHSGAGAYECGEESALLESFEGKRGVPRIRPPFPAVAGAYQCPTVLNNVETYCFGAGRSFCRRRLLRRSRHAEKRRNAAVLPLRPHQQARRLRTADGLQSDAHDQRGRRRHARREETESGDSRRFFLPGPEGR